MPETTDRPVEAGVAPSVLLTGGSAAFPLRDFLTRANVNFVYRDDDGPPGVAVCTLANGTRLVSPTLAELARHLDLLAPAGTDIYDLVIVGGGPAGLAAAVYAASEGLATAVIEREVPGGQDGTSSAIENYLGFPDGISGVDLADRARRQAEKFGAEMLVLGEVTAVFVVGGGNSAGQAAMNFANLARSVTLLVRGGGLAASISSYLTQRIADAPNVTVRTHTEVIGVDGDDWLRTITLRNGRTGKRDVMDGHALFICIGGVAHTGWVSGAGLLVDAAGYLVTGRDLRDPGLNGGRQVWTLSRDPYPLETTRPGVFAAGDVRRGSTKRVSAAVGEGAMAVELLHRFLAE